MISRTFPLLLLCALLSGCLLLNDMAPFKEGETFDAQAASGLIAIGLSRKDIATATPAFEFLALERLEAAFAGIIFHRAFPQIATPNFY